MIVITENGFLGGGASSDFAIVSVSRVPGKGTLIGLKKRLMDIYAVLIDGITVRYYFTIMQVDVHNSKCIITFNNWQRIKLLIQTYVTSKVISY